MPLVVCDTSPLRALHHLERVGLLVAVFTDVLAPPAVMRELARATRRFTPLLPDQLPGVQVRTPTDASRVAEFSKILDPGESEAIALAVEVSADAILIDEAAGRREAARLGLATVGVAGVLLRAKERGLLSEVVPLIVRLRSELDFFISDRVLADIRAAARE